MIHYALTNPGNPHLAASAIAPSGISRESLWCLNFGEDNHMTFSPIFFSTSSLDFSSSPIYTVNNTPLTETYTGTI